VSVSALEVRGRGRVWATPTAAFDAPPHCHLILKTSADPARPACSPFTCRGDDLARSVRRQVLVEICAARSAPPQRMPKTGRVGSSFSRASSCVMPRTIRTSPRRGTSCDDARVIRKSIDLVGKGWLDGQAVALTVGDVLVVEPGELHTFTDSSDDYRHFVVRTPFVHGDKRSG
jgi:hypothetical protein